MIKIITGLYFAVQLKECKMPKKLVAIVGTYRKGGITDQIVAEIVRAAIDRGVDVNIIHLLDKHIEFCVNCRNCTQEKDVDRRGRCVHDDDMDSILQEIDAADAIVLASPVNWFRVTALMKRFIERLVVYGYWPWDFHGGPKNRVQEITKRAVIVTSAACPGFIARLMIPAPLRLMKAVSKTIGAKVVDKIYFGLAAQQPQQKLTEKQRQRAYRAGAKLIG